jgi:hypothetical protein
MFEPPNDKDKTIADQIADGLSGTKKINDEFADINTTAFSIKGVFEKINDIIRTNGLEFEQINKVLLGVDKSATSIAKSFGTGRENIAQLKIAMGDAYVEVAKMGGKYTDIASIQAKVSADLGRNVILQTGTIEKLFAVQQVTGQNAEVITKSFKDAGMSANLAAEKMGNVVNIARSQGVNAQAVSKLVVDNMSNLNMYTFQGGVDGLAKMAAQATSMRINMQDTFRFSEKVFNPEGAIETAAALQRLGVTQSQLLDPLRLMDLAQNDPTELQNQITQMTQQFVQLNEKGQFEIMPDAKRQLREIETAMSYPAGSLSKMALGAAEVADKMSKIRFTGGFSEDEKKFIANMAEMGPGGTYTLKVDGKDMGIDKAMDLFSKDNDKFKQFMKDSKPKDMEDLAKEQLDTIASIDANVASMMNRVPMAFSTSKLGEDILEGYRKVAEVPATAFSEGGAYNTKDMREGLNSFEGDMKAFIKDFSTNEYSESEFTAKAMEYFKGIYNFVIENNKKVGKNFQNQLPDGEYSANDFILKTHPKDSIVFTPDMMIGGTNLFGGQQNSMSETKNTNDINLNVTLTSNGIDLNQMTKRDVLEPLVEHMKRILDGDGLLNKNGKTPNPMFNYQVS